MPGSDVVRDRTVHQLIKQIQQYLISTGNKENKFFSSVSINQFKLNFCPLIRFQSYFSCPHFSLIQSCISFFLQILVIKTYNIRVMDIKIEIDSRSVLAKRKYVPPSKRPASEFLTSQQPQQHDPKQYRILIHCFFNNINNYFAKRHKSVLGDLQDMYKIPLNKEERYMLQENIQGIIDRNVNKLARDAIFRNSLIAKNIAQYFESFQKCQKAEQEETEPNIEQGRKQQIQQVQEQSHFTLKVDSYKQEKRQRPFSSNYSCYLYKKSQQKTTPKKTPIFTKKSNRNNIFNQEQFLFDTLSQNQQNEENEVGECCVFVRQNCRRFNRLKLPGKSERISQNQMLVFQEEQGKIIDENNNSNQNPTTVGILNFQTEKSIAHLCKQGSRRCSLQSKNQQFEKSITKTNLNRFFNLNMGNTTKIKSIDQMQKLKIQNRILSMNGSLSTNIAKPQGYKPKSKCWGSATPSNGKLSYQMMKERERHNGKGALSMVRYK